MTTGQPVEPSPTGLLARHLPEFRQRNRTQLVIAAEPDVVWSALERLRERDLRVTALLMGVRRIPGLVARRGALGAQPARTSEPAPLLESLANSRFRVLDETPRRELVLGVIGQFWRLDGGRDADFGDAAEFAAFAEPGYVKAAINFRVDAHPEGTRVTTETRCLATDPHADRRFGRYWALIGWGSKVIRWDVLYATRRAVSRGG